MSAADAQRVTRALEFLNRRWHQQPSLDEVATHVGLSGPHFQRMFQRFAGVSPKRFLQCLTAQHARRILRESRSVLDAALDLGLSGPGRLHDLTVNVDAMTPGEIRSGGEGIEIRYGVHPTHLGRMTIGTTSRGICHLAFVAEGAEDSALQELHDAWPGATLIEDARTTRAALDRALQGSRGEVRLLLRGTNFQVRVWEALLRIPEGALVTYGDLAKALGKPSAARVVGSAVAKNNLAVVIPCHRVIRGSGVLADYRWGPARKQLLVGRELATPHGARVRFRP